MNFTVIQDMAAIQAVQERFKTIKDKSGKPMQQVYGEWLEERRKKASGS